VLLIHYESMHELNLCIAITETTYNSDSIKTILKSSNH